MLRPRAVIDDNVVKIKFLNKDGSLSDRPQELDIIPVIECSIEQKDAQGKVSQKASAIALIDTGCDHRALDKSFAESVEFIPAGTTSPSGIGGFVQDAKFYDLVYKIKTNGSERSIDARFVAVPLLETGRKYQVILGMTFLNYGRLIMDSQTHEYLFEFS